MWWLLITIVLVLSPVAEAAEITVVAEGSEGYPALILVRGRFMKEDIADAPRTFKAIAEAQEHGAIVFLESPGGSVGAAIEIGHTIRDHGFSTIVADNAPCTSACGLIWLAGREKYLGLRAQVGFHGAKDHETGQVSSHGNAMIGAYLYEMGVTNMTVITYLTKASPQSMVWVTPKNARSLKIEVKPLRGDLAMRTTRR